MALIRIFGQHHELNGALSVISANSVRRGRHSQYDPFARLNCPAGQFSRLMGAMMRARMLVAAIAATLGLLTAVIAAQAQAVKYAHRVTVATLHRP
jgi:hypothetical protein